MQLFVGTSGYSYKEWKGSFYPEKLAAKEMLTFYSGQLPAVEINNTFYRLPKESVLESWAEQVPESFRFAIKASQKITHFKRLKGAEQETEYFFRVLGTLGQRLGCVLFQLPPNMKKDLERLQSFVEQIPKGLRAAFEFRHDSWFDDEVAATLKSHACALVVAEDEKIEAQLVPTADWGYVRLRKPEYSEADLLEWAQRLGKQPWEQLFVFFKHEDGGVGPKLAKQFMNMRS